MVDAHIIDKIFAGRANRHSGMLLAGIQEKGAWSCWMPDQGPV